MKWKRTKLDQSKKVKADCEVPTNYVIMGVQLWIFYHFTPYVFVGS
jgi:hypothetical protein